jgi:DNA-binding LacI/PurR family transcriptional regulator
VRLAQVGDREGAASQPVLQHQHAVDELLGHRCAGLVVIGSHPGHAGMRALSRRAVVPVVGVGSGKRNAYYDVIRSSGDNGIDEMVTYLAEAGHRCIAYVDPAAMPSAARRRRGYDRAADRLGLSADVLSVPGRYRRGDYFEEAGATAARRLLEREELPTAVVAPNDHTAVGLLQILLRAGIRVRRTSRSPDSTTHPSRVSPRWTSLPSARTQRSWAPQPSRPRSGGSAAMPTSRPRPSWRRSW